MIPAIDLSATRHTPLPPRSRERFAQRVRQPRGELIRTQDGRELRLRSIEADDHAALKRLHGRLSPEDIRRRFLHSMDALPDAMAWRLSHVDPTLETALVLMDETARPAEMRGVARIYVDETTASAEFSVLVERDWARNGLGTLLMNRLIDDCRRRGLTEIWSYVLLENSPMLALCKSLGFSRRLTLDEPGTTQVSLTI